MYLDKTTLDGLGRTSCFPLYIAVANVSWEVYNQTSGMVLCALLPCLRSDPDWPHPGYKPRSEAFKETQRFFMHWSLSIIFETARDASFDGFKMTDPEGVVHNAVPFIHVISKDLGEASAISGVRSSACDSCLVPIDELHCLKKANQGAYDARLEDDMWCAVQEMQRHRVARAPHARIQELNREHGIHFIEVSLQAVIVLDTWQTSHSQCAARLCSNLGSFMKLFETMRGSIPPRACIQF